MNTQIQKSKQSDDLQGKTPVVAWFESCRCVFSFSFLVCCFLTVIAGAETSSELPASTSSRVSSLAKDVRGVGAPAVVGAADSRLRRKLWQASIGIPEEDENKMGENELSRIVEQVRSVEFKPQKEISEPVVVAKQALIAEPNKALLVAGAQKEVVEEGSDFKPWSEPVSSETLHMLEDLLEHPDRSMNPVELGDVLFLSENTKEAAKFYQEALDRRGGDDVRSASDRAWALFQTGNCLRHNDAAVAKEMYGQLIAGYPDSPLADLAKAQNRLIDWYQKDDPWTLVGDRILERPQAGDSKIPPE